VVGVGRWSALNTRWNYQVEGLSALSPSVAAGETVAITHYINVKPWTETRLCLRQSAFDEALMASGWFSPEEAKTYRRGRQRLAARHWIRTSVPSSHARKAAVYLLATVGL